MELLLVLIVCVSNIVCLIVGAKVGQTVSKGKDIEVPTINPMKIYREHVEKKEAETEKHRLDTILRNIDRYDGTGSGQEDVPR